jgi:hypothetical protein
VSHEDDAALAGDPGLGHAGQAGDAEAVPAAPRGRAAPKLGCIRWPALGLAGTLSAPRRPAASRRSPTAVRRTPTGPSKGSSNPSGLPGPMAESKRADPEGKYEFPVPPFDAQAYVQKELLNARASLILALFGVLLGTLGSMAHFYLNNPVASLAIFLLGTTAVKDLLKTCGADPEGWERKNWAGHIALLFFTWLSVWVLLQNPPFLAA